MYLAADRSNLPYTRPTASAHAALTSSPGNCTWQTCTDSPEQHNREESITMSQCSLTGQPYVLLLCVCVCVCVCALYIKLNNIICWFIQHNHKIIKTFPPHIYFTQQWCRYLRRLVVMYDNNLWIYLIKSMMVKHAFSQKKPTVFLQKNNNHHICKHKMHETFKN